jgi:hypothetical protein
MCTPRQYDDRLAELEGHDNRSHPGMGYDNLRGLNAFAEV